MSTTAAPSRAFRRPRDMILSLAVLLVPIGLFFVAWNFLTSDSQVRVIDPSAAFQEASGSGLAVVRPDGLGADWKPVSSAVSHEGGVTVRVGYQTPDGNGIQLVETDADAETLLSQELPDGAQPSGTMSWEDRDWQMFETKGGNAVVFSGENVTILVHGNTDTRTLESFISVLE